MFCDSVYQATAAPFDWTRASNTQSKIHYKPISARRRSDKTIYLPALRLHYAGFVTPTLVRISAFI